MLFFLVFMYADQAAMTVNVVRVVRVDVPRVVRSYDAKPEIKQPPLLLGCAYALEGGENDDEDGDVRPSPAVPANATPAVGGTGHWAKSPPAPEVAMDKAMEDVQRKRGLVVKWYFRQTPTAVEVSTIDDSEQVYQWIAGGGPEAGGGLGRLSGRVVDVSAETPRADKSALHRIIRVDRPTAELTGEYRCQVEDWDAERRSVWHPMVVYSEYTHTS